jgi:hypothetical protein
VAVVEAVVGVNRIHLATLSSNRATNSKVRLQANVARVFLVAEEVVVVKVAAGPKPPKTRTRTKPKPLPAHRLIVALSMFRPASSFHRATSGPEKMEPMPPMKAQVVVSV